MPRSAFLLRLTDAPKGKNAFFGHDLRLLKGDKIKKELVNYLILFRSINLYLVFRKISKGGRRVTALTGAREGGGLYFLLERDNSIAQEVPLPLDGCLVL